MLDITDKKYYSYQITQRFLFAMDRILSTRTNGKVTAQQFGNIVGIKGSNILRIRKSAGEIFITVESIGRLCNHYKISPYWLITGEGDIYSNQELMDKYKSVETEMLNMNERISNVEITLENLLKNKKG